jgi:hypothetical protein
MQTYANVVSRRKQSLVFVNCTDEQTILQSTEEKRKKRDGVPSLRGMFNLKGQSNVKA